MTAIATAGTFVVIAASAIAALVQLRHMRGSNQIAALNELRETMESDAFQNDLREVRTLEKRLNDPELRRVILYEKVLSTQEAFRPPIRIGNFFENAGVLVRNHIIDRRLFCELWAQVTIGAWRDLEELIANRRPFVGPALYENFEYLVIICERFISEHPSGTFPGNAKRKKLREPWPQDGGSDIPNRRLLASRQPW